MPVRVHASAAAVVRSAIRTVRSEQQSLTLSSSVDCGRFRARIHRCHFAVRYSCNQHIVRNGVLGCRGTTIGKQQRFGFAPRSQPLAAEVVAGEVEQNRLGTRNVN